MSSQRIPKSQEFLLSVQFQVLLALRLLSPPLSTLVCYLSTIYGACFLSVWIFSAIFKLRWLTQIDFRSHHWSYQTRRLLLCGSTCWPLGLGYHTWFPCHRIQASWSLESRFLRRMVTLGVVIAKLLMLWRITTRLVQLMPFIMRIPNLPEQQC